MIKGKLPKSQKQTYENVWLRKICQRVKIQLYKKDTTYCQLCKGDWIKKDSTIISRLSAN